MIENETQLKQARKALVLMENALLDAKKRVAEKNPDLFKIMAVAPLRNIIRLRQEIDEYVGVPLAIKEKAPFWVTLKGKNIAYGNAPASVLSGWLTNVVGSYKKTMTFLARKASQKIEKIRDFISLYSELYVTEFANGSIEIGFKLPTGIQLSVFEDEINIPEEALSKLSEAVTSLVSKQPEKELEKNFPDRIERRAILAEARKLIPPKDSLVEEVELSGVLVPDKYGVRLRPNLVKRIDPILEKLKEPSEEGTGEKIFEGWISAVDFFPDRFDLRNPDTPKKRKIKTFFFDSSLAEKVHEYNDFHKENPRKVEVKGIQTDTGWEAISIKSIEESE